MPNPLDLTGRTFGSLTITGRAGTHTYPNGKKRSRWRFECACGETGTCTRQSLRDGRTTCGSRTNHPHGRNHGGKGTPEYYAWRNMRRRCTDPDHPRAKDYMARGITVDPRWDDFPLFLADMGARPSPSHSLDRIDNDKGYGPDNCKWSTPQEQSDNRRPNHRLDTPWGVMTGAALARKLGLTNRTVYSRIRRGWPIARIIAEATPQQRAASYAPPHDQQPRLRSPHRKDTN